jgi:hypothetical protein
MTYKYVSFFNYSGSYMDTAICNEILIITLLMMHLISIYRAAKWHNRNNRWCKPTDIYKLYVTAPKRLNIRLVFGFIIQPLLG